MFTRARFKLTAWYLLIIMFISVSFSIAIYESLTIEFDRVERLQRVRQAREMSLIVPGDVPLQLFENLPRRMVIDIELIEGAKGRIKIALFLINLGILGFSSIAGFFLAGRTLQPIKKMVEEQDRFISDASHELRTPITALKTELEVNLRDPSLDDKLRDILKSNLEEVNNLQMLSDNLMKLTRYEKGNKRSNFEIVSLKEIVFAAVRRVGNLAKRKQIRIENNVAGCNVEVESSSLVEAFVIFLDNAIKYSDEKKKIVIESVIGDNRVDILIRDQGWGIAKEDLPHLFERFYRADQSRTKQEVSGYGLGLSIAKEVIERHKGEIEVESAKGVGSVMKVRLPLVSV